MRGQQAVAFFSFILTKDLHVALLHVAAAAPHHQVLGSSSSTGRFSSDLERFRQQQHIRKVSGLGRCRTVSTLSILLSFDKVLHKKIFIFSASAAHPGKKVESTSYQFSHAIQLGSYLLEAALFAQVASAFSTS